MYFSGVFVDFLKVYTLNRNVATLWHTQELKCPDDALIRGYFVITTTKIIFCAVFGFFGNVPGTTSFTIVVLYVDFISAQKLLELIEEISDIFWETKKG